VRAARSQEVWRLLTGGIEARWAARSGEDTIAGGWRASLRGPATLARYPMVLHRGGFPDGS
jgi:hypothetical protein